MKTKISFALIGSACIALITTAIYLGSLNTAEIFITLAIICIALTGGFYLLGKGGDKKGSTD